MKDSNTVMASPTAIALKKKNTGSIGVYHSPWSLSGAMTYSVPSDDWWRVESRTPTITSGT